MTPADLNMDLIESLVAAFVTTGKATMPAGRREDVVVLLTRLVVNPDLRGAYCRAIMDEQTRRGVDHRSLYPAVDSGDIPELEIARHGFGGLSDAHLVDYALCPPAINAIADRLDDDELLPDLGHWYIQAGKREVVLTPEDIERDRQLLLATIRDQK